MPLYREDLETTTCNVPGCRETHRDQEIYFHARCHPQAATWCRYRADVLTIECSICRRAVAAIVVASRTADADP